MGSTLKGREISGSPLETRGATSTMANLLQQYMTKGGALPFQRMQTDSIMNLLGFDPSKIGLGEAITSSIMDPAKATSGLFSALDPIQARETARAVAANAEAFGAMGGRFSPNLLAAQGNLLSKLGQTYAAERSRALLEANAQRNQAIQSILSGLIGAGNIGSSEAAAYLGFLQPGSPAYQPGALGDILGVIGNLAALKFLGR